MRIDCSNILNFKREHERMCKSYKKTCHGCPFENEPIYCCPEHLMLEKITEEKIDLLQKWSDEHPCKTLLGDFLEKYPNATISKYEDIPYVCADNLGYKSDNELCETEDGCQKCWNRLLDEVEKE